MKLRDIYKAIKPCAYIPDLYGDKGREYEYWLLNKLALEQPTWNDYLNIVILMRECGISVDRAIEIWQEFTYDQKFDKSTTETYIRQQYRYSIKGSPSFSYTRTPRSPKPLIKTVDELYTEFKKQIDSPIAPFHVSNDIHVAPFEYFEKGFHVVPKKSRDCHCRECQKREPENRGKHPSLFSWRDYQFRQPTLKEMESWDWQHGLCILATDEICFMDIDQPNYQIDWKGHREMTPRKGQHLFAYGNPVRAINVKGIGEIKKIGGLIVSAPTEGYQVIS